MEGLLHYEFEGLLFAGAYFWNSIQKFKVLMYEINNNLKTV